MEMTYLRDTQFHGFRARLLENEFLQVVVVPEVGGKIVSLYDKHNQAEWLVTPDESHPFGNVTYGQDFNTTTSGGWDEMFPNIIAGAYPAPGMYSCTLLPDHGEVWALPWQEQPGLQNEICLTVEGRALNYQLERRLMLKERKLLLRYQLFNHGPEPLAHLWAAHPQFSCNEGDQVQLPGTVSTVINVLPAAWGTEWGEPGTHNQWPIATLADSSKIRQDLVRSPSRKGGRKIYLPPESPIGWASIRRSGKSSMLRLDWNPEDNPYCGIWFDEGALNQTAAVAIEPTNGFYDSLSTAWENGRIASLPAGSSRTWELVVSLEGNE